MGRPRPAPRKLGLGRKLLFSGLVTIGFFGLVGLALALAGVRPILAR